jgi:peptidoglycan/xylan/chitin deacetylase (PgdA/CDA1 family)
LAALLVLTSAVGAPVYARPGAAPAAIPEPSTVRRAAPQPLRLPAVPPSRRVRVPILMYHRIDRLSAGLPSITRSLTVSPGDFSRQMEWIESHGYHTITQMQLWRALMGGRALPTRPVLITFDDAYRDVVGYAAPVLVRDHEHATAYVITDRLSHGRSSPWMLWSQLPLLERDGFDIGSHTVSHADLVAVGPARARFELRASRFALERFLHEPVQWLAYPYGKVDATVERLAREAGYVLAVTTQGGTTQNAGSPLLLRRDEITATMGLTGFATLLVNSSEMP